MFFFVVIFDYRKDVNKRYIGTVPSQNITIEYDIYTTAYQQGTCGPNCEEWSVDFRRTIEEKTAGTIDITPFYIHKINNPGRSV